MTPEEVRNKRLLISPLNWGMGHVSRCIGLIRQLILQENEVIVACDDDQRQVFEEYFDNLEFIPHRGYPFFFGGKGKFERDFASVYFRLRNRLIEESREVENQYVKKYKIDLVLSDHRYGFVSRKVPSIFITHQLNLPLSGMKSLMNRYHKRLIQKFNYVWVMDYPDSRLAGSLSKNSFGQNVLYIGPYSRFEEDNESLIERGKTVVIASGPTVYAQQLVDQVCTNSIVQLTVVSGKYIEIPEHVSFQQGSWKERDQQILTAETIISRSGYSTIMDLDVLKRKALLYPTPGQVEQEYLFELHRTNRPS